MISSIYRKPLRQIQRFHFSTSNKYQIEGLGKYSLMFEDSKIMENLIPRVISDSDSLDKAYPTILKHSCSNNEVTGAKAVELADRDTINKSLNEPIYDLMDRGGKRWRPMLGLIMARCLGRENIEDFEKNKDIYFSCGLGEIIHNGSLMVDDIEDNSEKRRGDLCTYKKFGLDVAINAGNFMYFAPSLRMDEYIPEAK